ncbi:MAG: undecaprenyldiphospho-muramoylpentapeptide beta-N-acetylglucosaminyltransferase [Spirochaeta sp.]|nr:undecaprenyldiphospho-muramoylpentapeptide beta-N-acetylglucosaminyltransferase [Spirochaeta sp.]RPG04670.1 MAG: undecaprenyldiphospho-muramoylpentapeptide beta-N-acetylglucosaminyltransferase [Proteobacteria bacterium TMED72]
MALSWIIAGGGTGGHVTPALALGEVLAAKGDPVLFIGSERGLEARLVPDAGFELLTLPSQQVMGRSGFGKLSGAFRILAQVGRARTALRERRADAVISVGGFAAMPAALAALLLRRPLILVEPNAIPGRVNRLTARFAQCVFTGFEEAETHLKGARKIQHVGIPLRTQLIQAFETSASRPTPRSPLRVLVFGGSQGARQINEAMITLASQLAPLPIEIFHQTGKADLTRVRQAYEEAGVCAEVVEFERDMPGRYLWADLAISRAGALTVAELAMAALPALLVPYPFAADDHQAANAKALSQTGAALSLDSRPLDPDRLLAEIRRLQENPQELVAMSQAATKRARPDAAREIIQETAATLQEHAV